MADLFDEPEGATPLTFEDQQALCRTDIALGNELNIAEADNILRARSWAFARIRSTEQLVRRETLRELHRRMFGEVWKWAGVYRQHETNIGVAPQS